MSKYARPKRNVSQFNADNFETELIQTTNDVLKITKNETSSNFSFYTIPDTLYTNQPKLAGFVSNNTLTKIIDDNMNFVNSGTYHVRLLITMRPMIEANLMMVCNLSPLEQFFKLTPSLYNQVCLETVVYANSGDELFFQILTTKGVVFVTETNNLRLVNGVLSVQQISSTNVLL